MNLAATLATLEEEGFAIVRGALSTDELNGIRAAFDGLLSRARRIAAGTEEQPPNARFVVDSAPLRLHRVVWAGGVEPTLAALGAHPVFLALAGAMLNSDHLVQLIQQAHFKYPGDDVSFGWHQDASNRRFGSELWADADGRGTYAQLCLAVDPMTPENDPLRMLKGSHKLGFIADPATGEIPNLPDLPIVHVELDPGDIALFGPFVIHGSSANTGDQSRRLFLQGYTLPNVNHRTSPGCGLGIPRRVSGCC